MKERIVIDQDWLVKDMKAGVPELDKLFICQKVEQVPENFSELKELCKKTGYYAVNILKDGLLDKEYIFIFGLSFRDNGDIEDIENDNVAENRKKYIDCSIYTTFKIVVEGAENGNKN